MNRKSLSFALFASCAALGIGPAGFAAAAATSGQKSLELEEVIVTANKREESVQKVAQTVNVVSGDELDNRQIHTFKEIESTVAGLSLARVSGGEEQVSMRGIAMPQFGGAGGATNTVEMYVNEVPISASDAFNSMFDIGQVEVLRGPQGTLRGRPSPSGAITIAPRRASYDRADGFFELSGTDHSGQTVQGAYGAPVSDTFAVRVAGFYDHNDDNQIKSLGNGKHSYHKTTAGRLSLGWKPTDKLELNLMEQYINQDQDFYRGIQGTDTYPNSIGFGQTFALSDKIALNKGANPNTYKGSLTTLTARYNFGKYALNYVGGYNDAKFLYVLDFDFAGLNAPPESPPPYLVVAADPKTFSNELRFESTAGEVYNFTYGAFTSKADYSTANAFSTARPYNYDLSPVYSYSFLDTGLFTNQRFNIGTKDSVSVGVRSSTYKVDRAGNGIDVKYSATTGNASYQHQFTDVVMGYASYGKSFRPGTGGVNQTPNIPNTTTRPIPSSFANNTEEKSRSLEVGLKSQWFGRRLLVNIAYYDQKYDGYIGRINNTACTGVPSTSGMAYATFQGTATGDNCRLNVLFNGQAVSKGVELEMNAKVTADWTVGMSYSYSNAHYENSLVPCNDYNGDGIPDNTGTPMIQQGQYVSQCRTSASLGLLAPHSFSANTSYNFRIGNLGAYVRANLITKDQAYFPQTGNYLSSDSRVNAYFGLKGNESKWDVSVWAKNLLDHVVQDNDGGTWAVGGVQTGLSLGSTTSDREVGATLRWNF